MAKILFVDDEDEFLDLVKSYFEELGHEVLTTVYGHQGLKLILEEKPDVAIIDARLKDELNGMKIIKQVHAQAPRQKMILFTGFKDAEMDAEAIRNGALFCLHKPMAGLKQFEETILATIEKKS